MKKRDYFIIGMCVLIFFLSAFHLGFTAGKDVTTISFTGLPDGRARFQVISLLTGCI